MYTRAGNRIRGEPLEGVHVTTTPLVLNSEQSDLNR